MKFIYIIEHETLPSVLIMDGFSVMIVALDVNDTVKGSKQMAELTAKTQTNELGKKILQDIIPVVYANKTGYTVTTYKENPTQNSTLIGKYVFCLMRIGFINFYWRTLTRIIMKRPLILWLIQRSFWVK